MFNKKQWPSFFSFQIIQVCLYSPSQTGQHTFGICFVLSHDNGGHLICSHSHWYGESIHKQLVQESFFRRNPIGYCLSLYVHSVWAGAIHWREPQLFLQHFCLFWHSASALHVFLEQIPDPVGTGHLPSFTPVKT